MRTEILQEAEDELNESIACRILRCLVVGEVAPAHDGSLGTAHAFLDAHRGFALAANQSGVNGQKSRGLAVRLGHLLVP